MCLEEKDIINYIIDILYTNKKAAEEVNRARYHHNTTYDNTPIVIQRGILSTRERAKLENRPLTDKELLLYNDENYVNGLDNISLSVVGLNDLYSDELEYNPFSPVKTDILITSDIRAGRCSQNYGNEFLASDRIENVDFRAIDIRLLQNLNNFNNGNYGYWTTRQQALELMVNNYNYLKQIAIAIIDQGLDIPLRDMSDQNVTLDIDKMSKVPELILK